MSTDRDRLLKENEDEARRIKEELTELREAMFRHENALNALAIERTNLESEPGEQPIEISPELRESLQSIKAVNSRRIWPKVALGALVLAGLLFGLGALGIFKNDGSAPIARRAVLPTPPVVVPSARKGSAMKGNEAAIVKSSSIPLSANADSTSGQIHGLHRKILMNILPGKTYTSEISYSMMSSAVTLVEVSDTPLITLHLSHAPQSFFIPLRIPFRIDSEGAYPEQLKGTLMVFADSKKHDLEIRVEPRKLPLERKILGVSSSQ